MMQLFFRCLKSASLSLILLSNAWATEYPLPAKQNALIGETAYVSTSANENLVNIGQRYNVGINGMLNANPGLKENAWLPAGTPVKVPAEFLLPPLERRGIVINLAEMRMYYYPNGSSHVMTFPIGIGKTGKTIPLGPTAITRKVVNPVWTPTPDIRAFNREQGIELPYTMPAGPDNPLGPYALYLRVPTYLIHSTIFPESIGRRASFGCIRMHESDIKQFFPLVQAGTPVTIIDMPNKVGWDNDVLYLETHRPLEERNENIGLDNIVSSIQKALPSNELTMVNWQLVSYLSDQRDGVPHEIGFKIN